MGVLLGCTERCDERPWARCAIVGYVVAFDVPDARQHRAFVEAETFVVTVGPNGAAGAQTIADGIFRAFDNIGDMVLGCANHNVGVPRSNVERVDGDV